MVAGHGLCWPMACRIFPDQGSNPSPLHQQVDSYPLYRQGSPNPNYYFFFNLEISVSVMVGSGSLFSAPKPALSSGGPSVVPCNKKDCVDVSVGEMEGCGFTLFFVLLLFEAI